jgi:hypothetical protein
VRPLVGGQRHAYSSSSEALFRRVDAAFMAQGFMVLKGPEPSWKCGSTICNPHASLVLEMNLGEHGDVCHCWCDEP